MPFDAQIRHFPTLADFTAYLDTVPRPAWCSGATAHNTYIPNETQWRGMASMLSMRQTYIDKGWSAGPHLYLAAECTNPSDRGIWQMTPLAHPGVHAGPCNGARLGIENVADWEARPPTPAQYGLLLDVLTLVYARWKLPYPVNVHKECMPGRTCPGQYLNADQLRVDLADRLTPPILPYIVRGLPVYNDSQGHTPSGRYLLPGSKVTIDRVAAQQPADYHEDFGHVADADGGGFIDLNGAAKL